MEKKLFDTLDASLKERLKKCKSEAEVQKVIAEAGLLELSPEMMEDVSGGTEAIPPEWTMKDE